MAADIGAKGEKITLSELTNTLLARVRSLSAQVHDLVYREPSPNKVESPPRPQRANRLDEAREVLSESLIVLQDVEKFLQVEIYLKL